MALNYKSSVTRYRRYLAAVEENSVWRAGVFVILSLVLLLIMVVFALRPTLLTIADLVTQVKEKQALSVRLGAKIEDVRAASQVLSENSDKLPLLNQAMPSSSEWLSWVQAVEGAATASGVTLESVTAGPVTEKGGNPQASTTPAPAVVSAADKPTAGVIPMYFVINVKSEYAKVKAFTEQLEQLRRVTVISEVTYAKDKDGLIETTLRGWIGYMIMPATSQQP